MTRTWLPIADAGRFLRNLARTMPLLPWDRHTFPQITRNLELFFKVFAYHGYRMHIVSWTAAAVDLPCKYTRHVSQDKTKHRFSNQRLPVSKAKCEHIDYADHFSNINFCSRGSARSRYIPSVTRHDSFYVQSNWFRWCYHDTVSFVKLKVSKNFGECLHTNQASLSGLDKFLAAPGNLLEGVLGEPTPIFAFTKGGDSDPLYPGARCSRTTNQNTAVIRPVRRFN